MLGDKNTTRAPPHALQCDTRDTPQQKEFPQSRKIDRRTDQSAQRGEQPACASDGPTSRRKSRQAGHAAGNHRPTHAPALPASPRRPPSPAVATALSRRAASSPVSAPAIQISAANDKQRINHKRSPLFFESKSDTCSRDNNKKIKNA